MGAESNTGRESHLSGTPGLYKTGPGLAGKRGVRFNLPDDIAASA